MKPILLTVNLGLFLLLVGCNQPTPTTKTSSTPPLTSSTEPKKTPAVEIELKAVNFDQLTKAIAAEKGKIVIVDVWATWCRPCVKEFPHLVEMHEKYAAQKVVCMSVSEDKLAQKGAALKFLKDQKASFTNFIWDAEEPKAKSRESWIFSGIPVVRVYKPSGELAKQFNNSDPDKAPFTYKDVEAVVQELLKK